MRDNAASPRTPGTMTRIGLAGNRPLPIERRLPPIECWFQMTAAGRIRVGFVRRRMHRTAGIDLATGITGGHSAAWSDQRRGPTLTARVMAKNTVIILFFRLIVIVMGKYTM
jgi:hypothetical protein